MGTLTRKWRHTGTPLIYIHLQDSTTTAGQLLGGGILPSGRPGRGVVEEGYNPVAEEGGVW